MATRAQKAARLKRKPLRRVAKSVNNSHTSPRRIERKKGMARALELREQGLTYDQIAANMGKPRGTVVDWVTEALENLVIEPAMSLLKLELARVDAVIAKIYPKALKGDDAAQKRLLEYLKHRCIMTGMYPRDGRSVVNVALLNESASAKSNVMQIEFVQPNGARFSLDEIKAEEISPGEFDARPQQTRPLPPQQIEHHHPFEHDTMRPRDPRVVRESRESQPEYRGPTRTYGTELDEPAGPRGTGQGRILDHGPTNGGKGWLK
jgi:hypothetical protein